MKDIERVRSFRAALVSISEEVWKMSFTLHCLEQILLKFLYRY